MKGQPRSRACQTEPDDPQYYAYRRMSEDFYARLGSERDLMAALKKSVHESCVLFHLAMQLARKKRLEKNINHQ